MSKNYLDEVNEMLERADVVEIYSYLDDLQELKPCCENNFNDSCEFKQLRDKMNELLSIKKPFMFRLKVAFNKGINEFKRHKALLEYARTNKWK